MRWSGSIVDMTIYSYRVHLKKILNDKNGTKISIDYKQETELQI